MEKYTIENLKNEIEALRVFLNDYMKPVEENKDVFDSTKELETFPMQYMNYLCIPSLSFNEIMDGVYKKICTFQNIINAIDEKDLEIILMEFTKIRDFFIEVIGYLWYNMSGDLSRGHNDIYYDIQQRILKYLSSKNVSEKFYYSIKFIL